jgi:hypothetical protein
MHTKQLLIAANTVDVPINVTTRIDGWAAVVVDETGDGVVTGSWDEDRARWQHDDDGLPVMRALLQVRDDANI